MLTAPLRRVLLVRKPETQPDPHGRPLGVGEARLYGELLEIVVAAVEVGAGVVELADALPEHTRERNGLVEVQAGAQRPLVVLMRLIPIGQQRLSAILRIAEI